jgi:hypothetical protein
VPALSGATTFVADDFNAKELSAFATRLKEKQDGVSQFLGSQLAEDTRQLLAAYTPNVKPLPLQKALAKDLTKIIESGPIFDAGRFAGVKLSEETLKVQKLIETATLTKAALILRLNRLLIEDAYPKEIELGSMIMRDGKGSARNSQGAFPMMVKHLLPPGLRGLVVAALLSALMGSLAGVFNACSTLFTVDLYEKWKPQSTQHQLVRMGRIATIVMVLIALAWIPVIQGAHGLYGYLQAVQGYLAPPIFVVFFFGVFFKRLNAQGCFWAMVIGFILGIFRMLVDTPVTMKLSGYENGYTHGSFLWIINNINFQYFSVLITIVSAIVMVAVSYLTAAPDYQKIKGLAFGTATDDDKKDTRASWDWKEVAASVLVLVCILGAYLYFNG